MNDNPKILYKFPSRSRRNKFFSAIDNIHELSTHENFEILCTFDIDDIEMANEEVKERLLLYPKVRAMYGTSMGKIHACNKDMEFSGEWDIVILMSDDQKFLVKGFDSIIVEKMKEYFPDMDGVLNFPDSHAKHELCTLSIIGRKYFNGDGWIYNPIYRSVWADNEFTWTAIIRNKYAFIPIKIYDHFHPVWGMSQMDALYARNEERNMYAYDGMTFQKRKAENFGLYTL